LTLDTLPDRVDDGLLCPCRDGGLLEWIVPDVGAREPNPPPGYVVSFLAFHDWGLEMLASQFMRVITHYYGVELHNFNPNSITQAAIFVTLCEGFLGIAPQGAIAPSVLVEPLIEVWWVGLASKAIEGWRLYPLGM
jgi:hypothetical protein